MVVHRRLWAPSTRQAQAHRPRARAGLNLGAVGLGLWLASCAQVPRGPEAQATAALPAPAPAPDAQSAPRAPSAVALGVFELQLPGCAATPSAAEAIFCASASRAVRAAYEDDNDDPSVLLALTNDLEVNPALAALQPLWRGPLGHALSRSEGLLRLGPTLRLLRRSVADAYQDPVSGIYRGVNSEGCRAAFALLPAGEPHWLEMVVTIEPLGTYPLSRLRRFCLDSRTL